MSPLRKISLLLCSVALVGSVLADGPKQLWAKSLINQPAPPLTVEKWLTPEPDRKGKFVLIDFWATWCPPCRAAIQELNELKARFGDRLVVIGLSDEPEAKIAAFQTDAVVAAHPEWKISYSVAIDTQKTMKNQVQVTGIPHVLIIDPKGIVRWEGFPFLAGYRLTPEVVQQILAAPAS